MKVLDYGNYGKMYEIVHERLKAYLSNNYGNVAHISLNKLFSKKEGIYWKICRLYVIRNLIWHIIGQIKEITDDKGRRWVCIDVRHSKPRIYFIYQRKT